MTSDLAERPVAAVPVPQRRRRDPLLALPALLSAALGTTLLLLRPSLWYDELFTAHVAPLPLSRIAEAVLSGEGTASYLAQVPPSYNAPYYVVVHGWLALTGLSPGELSLRSLSVLATAGAVGVLTLAVARLGGRAVGVAAGLLVATNPLVLEYSVEARGYGLAMLAVAVAVLGLARWLDGGRLLLWAAGATAAGLAHWFALPVVAGLALAALLLRGRRALPLLAVTVPAVLPALGLVVLASVQDDGSTTTGWIRDTGGAVPWLSLQAWTAGSVVLLVATAAACGAAVTSRNRAAVVGACWVAVPLLVVTLAELVRPVFVPRYLLPALLGLAVVAAAGVAARRRGPLLVAALVAASLAAATPLLDRPPREDARGAVAALAAQHAAGQPVVAVDRRAALALEQYGRGSVREELLVPPQDPPAADPAVDVVWLLRQASREGVLRPSDDDAALRSYGFEPAQEQVFRGSSSWLVLQRWKRPSPSSG